MYSSIIKTLKRLGLRSILFKDVCSSEITYLQLEVRISNTFYYLDLIYDDVKVYEDGLTPSENPVVTLGDIIKSRLVEIGDSDFYYNEYDGCHRKIYKPKDVDSLINRYYSRMKDFIIAEDYDKFRITEVKFYKNPVFLIKIDFTYKGAFINSMIVYVGSSIHIDFPNVALKDGFKEECKILENKIKEVLGKCKI